MNTVLLYSFRYIYNLVSKDKYSDKGDYELLRQSLEAMREHAISHNVTKLGRPTLPLLYYTKAAMSNTFSTS